MNPKYSFKDRELTLLSMPARGAHCIVLVFP
jgi:hypothetical protein